MDAGGTATWTAQASWNGDTLNGSGASGMNLTTTDGNVYKIQYSWLGFGVIKFYVQSSVDVGAWILAHTIQYPNAHTATSLNNGSLRLWAESYNTGTAASGITLHTSSLSGFIEGRTNPYNVTRNSIVTASITPAASPQNLLTIQNTQAAGSPTNPLFNSITSQVMIYPDFLAVLNTAGAGSNDAIRIYLTTGVTGTLPILIV